MTRPTLEPLEARFLPATVYHAVGQDYTLQGTTLYQRDVPSHHPGRWSVSLTGVRAFVLADRGQVANALLSSGQIVSSVHTDQVNTPWSLALGNVASLGSRSGTAIAALAGGQLKYNDYRVGPGSPWVDSPNQPVQPWEIDWVRYSNAQRQLIEAKVNLALSRLPAGATEFEKAAALTSFIHQWVHRKGGQDTQDGYDVLVQRYAVCGGMAVTLAECLLAAGISAQHFYELGGQNPAHSMLEADFRDGSHAILDPYYGVVYYDVKAHQPVGVPDLPYYLAGATPCTLVCKRGNYRGELSQDPPLVPMKTLLGSFDAVTSSPPNDYRYPDIFTKSIQRHLSFDGLPVTINVPLTPWTLLGRAGWQPSAREATPWSALTGAIVDGDHLSWAYTMGRTSGAMVEHTYDLSRLIRGRRYRLVVYVAGAGTLPDLAPTPSLLFQGAGTLQTVNLQNHFWHAGQAYQPQIAAVEFTAHQNTLTIHASALGALVIAGIQLQTV